LNSQISQGNRYEQKWWVGFYSSFIHSACATLLELLKPVHNYRIYCKNKSGTPTVYM